jgi:hypothetical protein
MPLNPAKTDILFARRPPYPLRHRSVYVMIFFFLLIIMGGYIFFKSSTLFAVPALTLETPSDGAYIQKTEVLFRGVTEAKTKVSINGYEVMSNDHGAFEVSLPFQHGFHTIDIRARNRLGREARIVHHIVVE